MGSQDGFERRAFMLVLLGVSVLFATLLKPFWAVGFWATAITVVFSPVHKRLLARFPARPGAVAGLTLLLCVVLTVAPAIFLAVSLAGEGMALYARLQAGDFDPASALEKIRGAFPMIEHVLHRFDINFDSVHSRVAGVAMSSGEWFAQQALALGQNAFSLGLSLVLTLYLTFFFLRDGDVLVNLIVRALPLGDARERHLIKRFTSVTRATIKGSLVVAGLQGTLGGITFALLGIQGALLWGAVMVLVSLVPAVGSALIWVPVAVYLAATGDWVSAAILVGVGVGIISTVDSVLRPVMVGRDTQLPDYLVLLSTLGGISLFGMQGLILGPLVAALFLAFWDIFIREFDSGRAPG